jgi:CheY-like chemotaxis protein
VTSAERAMATMEEFKPDVIVSDIAMPGQDGYEFLRQLRREGNHRHRIRALALTALSSPEDRRRAFEAGYRLHLAKPVNPNALAQAVAELAVA